MSPAQKTWLIRLAIVVVAAVVHYLGEHVPGLDGESTRVALESLLVGWGLLPRPGDTSKH